MVDGKVTALRGDPDHPITQGFLCHRTANFLARQYAVERITTPLIRVGTELVPASWEQALQLCATKMLQIRQESGPAAIFQYLSGGSLGLLQSVVNLFWQAFGPVTTKRGDICSGAGDAAQELDFGIEDSNDIYDLLNSRHIVLWGKNPAVSGPHLAPILRQARAQGCTLTLIDPVHHKSVHLCDEFVQVRPAGDFALAMAVAQVLFDRGWIAAHAAQLCDNLDAFAAVARSQALASWCEQADVQVAVAERLAEQLHRGPTAILVGWGMGRRGNGGAIVRALDALCAISGNLQCPGGGVSFYFKRRGAFDTTFASRKPPPRTVCEPLFGQEILAMRDPPIRMVWITAGNPVAMLPDAQANAHALRTREFVVVVDSFLTDTAQLAHVVLPTATLLETDDMVGAYGHHWLGTVDAVVPPLGQSRTDLQIVQALAELVGVGEIVAGTPEHWRQRVLALALTQQGITIDAIRTGTVRNPLAPKVLFAEIAPQTATGRVQLLTTIAPQPEHDSDYPFKLMSLSTEKSQSSQWVRVPKGPAEVTVHPDAAGQIADGSLALLQSPIGELQVLVRYDYRQRKDVAIMAKGGHYAAGRCANVLVQAKVTDIGEGGALYDQGVRLVPVPAVAGQA